MDQLILLQKLLVEEVNTNALIAPLTINQINKAYENGKFLECQKIIIDDIQEHKELNNFMLLTVINCEILITDTGIDNLKELFDISITIINDFLEKQTNDKYLDSLCEMILVNIYQLFDKLEITFENNDAFDKVVQIFQDFVKKLNSFSEKSLASEKIYQRIIQCIQRHIKAVEQNDEQELKEDTKNNKQNKISEKSESLNDTFASSHWYILIKKCYLLPKLIKEGRLFEAAIVYDDIELSLQSFDPKVYFPGLFFDLFKALAPVASQIHQYISQHQNSLQWYLSERLYQSDLDRFINEVAPAITTEESAQRKIDVLPELSQPIDRSLIKNAMKLPKDNKLNFNNLANDADDNDVNTKLDTNQKMINSHKNTLQSAAKELVDSYENESISQEGSNE